MSGDANSIAKALGVKPGNSDEVINAYSIKLAPIGFPAYRFLEASYLQVGFMPKFFAKYLKSLDAFNEDEHLEQVLQLGVSNGYFSSVRNCSAQGFDDFLNFLRSPAGWTELYRLVSERKKLKRSRPGINVTDIEYQKMLVEQSVDAKNAEDAVRAKYSPIIEELEERIRIEKAALELELEATKLELEATKLSFKPWCDFPAMDNASFNQQCWDLYIADCADQGVNPLELDKPNLESVVGRYKDRVRWNNQKTFLTDERKEQLSEYVRVHIGHFAPSHEEKKPKKN